MRSPGWRKKKFKNIQFSLRGKHILHYFSNLDRYALFLPAPLGCLTKLEMQIFNQGTFWCQRHPPWGVSQQEFDALKTVDVTNWHLGKTWSLCAVCCFGTRFWILGELLMLSAAAPSALLGLNNRERGYGRLIVSRYLYSYYYPVTTTF